MGWAETAKLRQSVLDIGNRSSVDGHMPLPGSSPLLHTNSVRGLGTLSEGVMSGLLDRRTVLVEFRRYLPTTSLRSYGSAQHDTNLCRVEQLAALLQTSKDAAFRLPHAQGYYQDEAHARFGLCFDTPEPMHNPQRQILTLQKLMLESSKTYRISERCSNVHH